MLPTQTDEVEAQLSRLLNADVTIGDIRGEWFRFGPILALDNLQVRTQAESQVHSIGRAVVSFDISASLLTRRLVVETLSVADLSLGLQQQADGRWALAGIAGNGADNSDLIMDFLLQTSSININEAEIALESRAGQAVTLGSILRNIQNSRTRHDAQLQLRVNGQLSPAQATLQLDGDPRSTYSATAWLDSDQLDWLPLARAALPQQWQWQQLEGRTRLWASLDSNGIRQLTGVLEDVQVEARHDDRSEER